MAEVTVVGSGVVGLTTALVFQEAGHAVQVIAAEPPERTTSAAVVPLRGRAARLCQSLGTADAGLASRALPDRAGGRGGHGDGARVRGRRATAVVGGGGRVRSPRRRAPAEWRSVRLGVRGTAGR